MYSKEHNLTNPNLQYRNDLFCQYCGKQCKNLNSLKQHELRCKENPNRKCCNNISNKGWAKGLTKETDYRINKLSVSKKNYHKTHEGTFTGKHHSEETKKKLSESQLKVNHANHNRYSKCKKGYFDGIFFMSTWELAYYIYIKNNFPYLDIRKCVDRFQYEYEGKKHYYTPDFIVNNCIIEIKGQETQLDRIKYEAVDNLIVLYYDNIKFMIDYVKHAYQITELWELYEGE